MKSARLCEHEKYIALAGMNIKPLKHYTEVDLCIVCVLSLIVVRLLVAAVA